MRPISSNEKLESLIHELIIWRSANRLKRKQDLEADPDLIQRLGFYNEKQYFGEADKIKRGHLRELISGALNITDAHTINGWIIKLLGKNIIEANPHTQMTRKGYLKPSNDTKYIILAQMAKRASLQTSLTDTKACMHA